MNDADLQTMPETGDDLNGDFVLVRKLGQGGMGIVFEAKHRQLFGKCAIKFLLSRDLHGSQEQARFVREARAGWGLESEYSARVLGVGTFVKHGVPLQYIVMEYLSGKNLEDVVAFDGPLPLASAVDYILQACVALAEAHGKNILHRDLKPSNLFLANRVGSEVIKVLDFGLAKDTAGADLTKSWMIAGTPGYMPHEQLRGLANTCPQTDIFSLAVCLYFLLTNVRPFGPFEGDELADVVVRIGNGTAPPPMHAFRPDVPRGLVSVIEQSLLKDPKKRPATMVAFARAIAPYGSADAKRLLAIVERTAIAAAEITAKATADGDATVQMRHVPKPTVNLKRAPEPRQPRLRPMPALLGSVAALLLLALVIVLGMLLRKNSATSKLVLPEPPWPKFSIPSSLPSPKPTVSAPGLIASAATASTTKAKPTTTKKIPTKGKEPM